MAASQSSLRGTANRTSRSWLGLTAVDLFAGAGGFTLAAQNLGIDVLAAVENDPHACDTYRNNLAQDDCPKLYPEDIRSLNPKTLMDDLGLQPGDVGILMGGPPCQGFSRQRIKGAGVGDPRNELILRYFDFVRELRPRAFIVENVRGMMWPRHASYVDRFYRAGEEAGYAVLPHIVLDAKCFGVPQNRQRVFILGFPAGNPPPLVWPPLATHFVPDSEDVVHTHKPAWRPASDVFEQPPLGDDANDVHMLHGAELTDVFRHTPKRGGSRHQSGRVLDCHKEHRGHSDVYGRIDPEKPGPTMTCSCINPSKGRFVHPEEDHGITVRQAARFQTFPDWFVFSGGLMSTGAQVGNAVPIRLGEAVLDAIAYGLVQCSDEPCVTREAVG